MRLWRGVLALVVLAVTAPAAVAAPATLWASRPFDDEPFATGDHATFWQVFLTPDRRHLLYATDDPAVTGNAAVTGRQLVVHDAYTGTTEILTPDGWQAPPIAAGFAGDMVPAGLSGDGRRIVFLARADAQVADVPPGTNGYQVFLYDHFAGEARMLGLAPGNAAPNGTAVDAAISDDGSTVAWTSTADNITTNADGPLEDVYVTDLETNANRLVSPVYDPGPGQLTYGSAQPALSGDGQLVAYTREAEDDSTVRVHRRDMLNGGNPIASVDPSGTVMSAAARRPSISANGQYVTFTADPGTGNEVYVRDVDASFTFPGRESAPPAVTAAPIDGHPQIDPATRYLAFQLEDGSTWTRRFANNHYERQDVPESGAAAADGPSVPGRVGVTPQGDVAFVSEATNLAPYAGPDADGESDVFLRGETPEAPVSVTAPEIADRSGDPTPAAACGMGGWEEYPERFRYQWLRRAAGVAADPEPLPGETKRTHLLTVEDQGRELLCRVTASNAAGSAQATSGPLAVNFMAPQNSVRPSIAGTPRVGMALTCDRGRWATPNRAPFELTQRWLREGQPIPGAGQLTYTVTEADLDRELRCSVTATAAVGSRTEDSAPIVPATGPPVFDVANLPTLQGGAVYGTEVGCGFAALPAPRVLRVTYAWLLDGTVIAGETESAIRVPEAAGRRLGCRVTLRNDLGETTQESTTRGIVRGVPVNRRAPEIQVTEGATPIDRVLTCDPGAWDEDVDATTAYEWYRNDVLLEGYTGARFKVTVDDLGRTLACKVAKTNAAGTAYAVSAKSLVPLPAADAGTRVMQHLGFNQYDPSNFLAVTDRRQRSYDELTRGYYGRQVDAYRHACTTSPPAATDARRAPTCAILARVPTHQLTLTLGGAFVDSTTFGPCGSTGDAACVRLPIDFEAPNADDVAGGRFDDESQPVAYLWDLDASGTVDVACPASAPVARLLYPSGRWKLRVTVVQEDSGRTGILPTADFTVDIGGNLRSTRATSTRLQALSRSTGAERLRVAASILPSAGALLPSAANPGLVVDRRLRPNQPIACKTSLTPPPEKTNLPCVESGQVGRVSLEGNLCPISLRQMPQDEIDALPEDVRKVLDERAFREEAKAVSSGRRWAPWLQARRTARFAGSRAASLVDLGTQFDDFTTAVRFRLRRETLAALKASRSAFPPEKAAFAFDQIYLARAPNGGVPGKPEGYGALKVNGVSVMPAKGSGVLVIPSLSAAAVVDTDDASIRAAAKEQGITDPKDVEEFAKKAKAAKRALSNMTISASTSVQGLVDGATRIPLSPDKPAEFEATDLDDAKNAAKAQVLAELKNLAAKIDLGPFAAAGGFKATLAADNTVLLETQASFPAIFRDESGRAPTFGVALRGTPAGSFTLEDVKIEVPGTLNILVLQAVETKFHYNGREQLLELQGKLRLLPPAGPTIAINDFRLKRGRLEALDVDYVGPPGIPIFPGVFITQIGGGFRDDGTDAYIAGRAEVAVGPGGSGCSAIGLRGGFRADYKPDVKIDVSAGMTVICIPLLDVKATISRVGGVTLGVGFDYTFGPAFLNGEIKGNINPPPNPLDAKGLRWQLEIHAHGGIDIPVIPTIEGELHGVASDSGIGACGSVTIVKTFSGGAGVRFARPNAFPTSIGALVDGFDTFTGCDIGRYSSGRATRLAADGDRVTRLPQDTEVALVSVEGSGGPPAVSLVDPSGKVVADGTTGEGAESPTGTAIRFEKESKTVFFVRPRPGDYTVRTAPGSVPVFSVTTASVLPKPKVTARVTGRGAQRVLRYDVRKLPGQQVRFTEQVEGGGQNLAPTVEDGGRGRLRFTVSESKGSRRTIVAQVSQDGMPRQNIEVARFVQASPKVGPPRKVRVKRTGTSVRVTWARGTIARETLLAFSRADGAVRTAKVYAGQPRRVRFAGTRGRLELRSVSALGRVSAARRVKVMERKRAKRGRTCRRTRGCPRRRGR